MDDPELRSDESVILRTQGIFVKSIPFEGILTNKRIILIDRAKNLLPQKEIPLVTIKDLQAGENAIRDQIITLSVVAKSGEIRQMILTFSRQTGGNRIRERDAWEKALKENISSSFEQVIRKVIPGRGPAPQKPERTVPPRIEINAPESQNLPPGLKRSAKKETRVRPAVKISESTKAPAPSPAPHKTSDLPGSGYGVYCSRCGNRVPEGSGFCNRCGSQIVPPATMASSPAPDERLQPSMQEAARTTPPPAESPAEPVIDHSMAKIQSAIQEFSQQSDIPQEPDTRVPLQEVPAVPAQDTTPDIAGEKPGEELPVAASPVSESSPPAGEPPAPRDHRGFSFIPNRTTIYAIILVLVIIAAIVGGLFIYPLISNGRSPAPNATASPTPVTTTPGTGIIIEPTPEVTVPAEGVYVHIRYLGGWKGSYGTPSDLKTVTNSGERYYPVENVTGIVEASFEKLDGSAKQTLVVEILENGRILTTGNTTDGFGKVALSVDTATV